jgi:hypothetical protein
VEVSPTQLKKFKQLCAQRGFKLDDNSARDYALRLMQSQDALYLPQNNQIAMQPDLRGRKEKSLSDAERRLVEYLRQLRWGSAEITVQNGQPVLIKAAVKTIKLTP